MPDSIKGYSETQKVYLIPKIAPAVERNPYKLLRQHKHKIYIHRTDCTGNILNVIMHPPKVGAAYAICDWSPDINLRESAKLNWLV